MKKSVVALVTMSAVLGVSAAVYAAGGSVGSQVQAAQVAYGTVSFVDRDTGKIVSSTKINTFDTDYGQDIPVSDIPEGYYADDVNASDELYVYFDQNGNAAVPVYKAATVTVNYRDSLSGKIIATQEAPIAATGNHFGYMFPYKYPNGYHKDNLYDGDITDFEPGNTVDVYVTNRVTETVEMVDVNHKSLGFQELSTAVISSSWNGYRLISDSNKNSNYQDSYGYGISRVDGHLQAVVRPVYDGKTVPIELVDETGNHVGKTNITFATPDYLTGAEAITSDFGDYEFLDYGSFASAMNTGFESGNFQLTVTKKSDQSTSSNNSSSGQLNNLKDQYANLTVGQGSTNTSALQKQIDALSKRIAALETQQAANSASKSAAISAIATVTGAKAQVYNADFKPTSRKLSVKSSWKAFAVVIGSDGQAYYNLGGKQFVRASAVSIRPTFSETSSMSVNAKATVHYVPGYGIQVWGADFKTPAKTGNGKYKKLQHNSSWKVFAIVKHNGHVYYNLGGKQYIDAKYATLK